jgi:UDP-2,3-diacylglucosamine pyrophosphatase LpxH
MTTTTGYKVVIMSDLHLGMKDSSPKKILEFLDSIHTDLLILNGDIIDIDALKRGSKWKNKHTKVIMKLLDMSRDTDIIYIRGNHDSDLEDVYGYKFGNIKFMDEYIYNHDDKKMLIFHGDKIDVTVKYKFLSQIGSIGYDLALRLNTLYNEYRMRTGKPYYSISKWIKKNVKNAISFINDFEINACEYAKSKKCDSVICGHIHIPVIKKIDGINYYNSGDWVENFSCLVLTSENEWKLIER